MRFFDVENSLDYYSFGMLMPERFGGVNCGYGYQGTEKGNEVKGEGNSYTTHFRQLDPRLGRWLTIDPKASSLPWQSPYCSMDNNPVLLNDVLGDTTDFVNEKGELLLHVEDGSSNVFVIKDKNIDKFEKIISIHIQENKHLNKVENAKLGESLGFNLKNIKTESLINYPKEDVIKDGAWEEGYKAAYNDEIIFLDFAVIFSSKEDAAFGINYYEGVSIGNRHQREGKMNIFNPKLSTKKSKYIIEEFEIEIYRAPNSIKYYKLVERKDLTYFYSKNKL